MQDKPTDNLPSDISAVIERAKRELEQATDSFRVADYAQAERKLARAKEFDPGYLAEPIAGISSTYASPIAAGGHEKAGTRPAGFEGRQTGQAMPSLFSSASCSAWNFRLTRSRSSLPGLKCGTYLPLSSTESPVFGLRPTRGGR